MVFGCKIVQLNNFKYVVYFKMFKVKITEKSLFKIMFFFLNIDSIQLAAF